MKTKCAKTLAALAAAIFATAALGLAKVTKNVEFTTRTQLCDGQVLKPGTYRMVISQKAGNADVKFYGEDHMLEDNQARVNGVVPTRYPVAEVHAEVVPQMNKNRHTRFDSVRDGNAQLLTKIQPAGEREALIFPGEHNPNATLGYNSNEPVTP